MARTLGIDIGRNRVRGVLLEGPGGGVVGAEEVTLPAGTRPASDGGALQQALVDLRQALRPGAAAVAVTAEMDVAVARTRLPFTEPRRIRKVLKFHVEDRFPFDITDWGVDYLPVKQTEAEAELLVFAARRDELAELMEVLVGAGLYPRAVLPRAAALGHAAHGPGGQAETPGWAAVWPGRRRLELAVGKGERLVYARSIPLGEAGTTDITPPGLAQKVLREARAALLTAGLPTGECPLYLATPDEGDGELMEQLRPMLGSRLHELASVWTGNADTPSESPDHPTHALARGAALAVCRGSVLDVARSVRSPTLTLRTVSGPLTAFLVVALLGGLALLASEFRQARRARRYLEHNRQALEQTWEALYPGEEMPPDPLLRVRSDLRSAEAGAKGPERRVAARPLVALERVIGALPAGEQLQVEGFQLSGSEMVLNCSAKSLGAADRAVAALQDVTDGTVAAGNPESGEGDRPTFDLRVNWRQRGGAG